jgi:type I restriction-modification system DNA methylase subunit
MVRPKLEIFIWGIPDNGLRYVYVRGNYRDIVLPMTVIRRLDAILEPTKGEVLTMREYLDRAGASLPAFDTALEEPYGAP